MKITPPRIREELCEALSLTTAVFDAVGQREDLAHFRFSHQKLEEIQASAVEWKGCVFENTVFQSCSFPKGGFQDCVFMNCDLSNLNLRDSSLQRVLFENCKLTGLNLFESYLTDVSVYRSNGKYINLPGGKLKNVRFENCDLSGAVFDSCELEQTVFWNTRLSGADFLHTRLNNIDVTTCEIDGISLSGSYELKGIVVTPSQACELARFLGVTIQG